MEKSVPEQHGEAPLNNFNIPANYPWIYIWTPPIQMMSSFSIFNPFCDQSGIEQETKIISVS